MEGIDELNLAFNISAMLISFTCLLFSVMLQRVDKLNNKIFMLAAIVIGINAAGEAFTVVTVITRLDSELAFLLVKIKDYLYFITHISLGPIFYYYVAYVSGGNSHNKKYGRSMMFALFLLSELLIIINPLTSFVYYYNSEHIFTRNWAEYIIYTAMAVYFIMAVIKITTSWPALSQRKRTSLMFFFMFIFFGIMIQLFNYDVQVELISESLGLIGVMALVENEDDRIDADTGLYNRRAFRSDLKTYKINKCPVYIIGIRMTNAEIVSKAAGYENTNTITSLISSYLKDVYPRYNTYNINAVTLAMLLPDKEENEALEVADTINRRFESPWKYRDINIILSAVIMIADIPGRLSGTTVAFGMLDGPVPSDGDKTILAGEDLEYIIRRSAVENAVSRGLEEHSFEVHFQPTYHLHGNKLHGAEALVRMHDRELGNVYPDEFIPVAERMGVIDSIDDFVLREVCRFINSGIPEKFGMDCINVNLSVLECMKPGFVEHINKIVEEAGVDKSYLNFEITESIAADDYLLLSKVISDLKNEGFQFSMDDYGTGYSNMNAILSLNLDVIKIDKSILRGAEQSRLGYIMLEYSIRMFRQMNRKVLVEGVETAEQVKLLEELDVDYLQGYYFSRPLPERNFVDFIKKNSVGV